MAEFPFAFSSPMSSAVFSINVSVGGVPKLPVPEAMITTNGVQGDKQRNRRFHGGPARAVCLYSLERIRELQSEGHPISPGSVGENLTLSGLDWPAVTPGAILRVGDAQLEVTSYTQPCGQIRKSFVNNDIDRIAQAENPGWSRVYARVLKEGMVRVGDSVQLGESRQGALELP